MRKSGHDLPVRSKIRDPRSRSTASAPTTSSPESSNDPPTAASAATPPPCCSPPSASALPPVSSSPTTSINGRCCWLLEASFLANGGRCRGCTRGRDFEVIFSYVLGSLLFGVDTWTKIHLKNKNNSDMTLGSLLVRSVALCCVWGHG